jgi:hypothetical protein
MSFSSHARAINACFDSTLLVAVASGYASCEESCSETPQDDRAGLSTAALIAAHASPTRQERNPFGGQAAIGK